MNEKTPPGSNRNFDFDLYDWGQRDSPEFDVEPAKPVERRNTWTWLAVAMFFLLVIVAQNSGQFMPVDETPDKFTITAGQTGELRRALLAHDLGKSFGQGQLNQALIGSDVSPRRWKALGETKMGYAVIAGLYLLESEGKSDEKTIELLELWRVAIEEARADLEVGAPEDQLDTAVLLVRAAKGEELTPEEIELLEESPDVPMFISETVARLYGEGEPPARGSPMAMLAFVGYMLFVGFLGFIGWVGLAALGLAKRLPKLELIPSSITKGQADRLAGVFLLGMLVFVSGIVLVAAAMPFLAGPFRAVLTAAIIISAICLLLSSRLVGIQGFLSKLKLTASGFFPGMGFGFVAYTMTLPAVFLALLVALPLQRFFPPPSHPVSEQLSAGVSGPMFITLFITAVVIAPVAEEILFRGALLPAMAKVKGSLVFAIIVTSVLFAAIHPTGVVAWPALAMLGAMCALVFLFTRNIWSAIWLHAFWNGTLLIASFAIL